MRNSINRFQCFLLPENILMLSGVVAAIHLGKVTPALPSLINELGITVSQSAFLLSAIQFAGASIGIAMGLFTDGLGSRKSILLGQVILAIASVLAQFTALSAMLLILRGIESIGFLMIVLATPKLIRHLVPENKLAFRIGLWGCYMAIGTSISFFSGSYVIEVLGWAFWWNVSAALSVLCIILIYFTTPLDKVQKSRQKTSSVSFRKNLFKVAKYASPWLIGAAFAMYAGQWLAVIGLLPIIYGEHNLSAHSLGAITAMASLSNILGNLAAGLYLQRKGKPIVTLVTGYLTMVVFSVLILNQAPAITIEIKFMAVILFSMVGGLIPGTLFYLTVQAAQEERYISTTLGLVQQLSSLGMVVIPPFLAWSMGINENYPWIISSISLSLGLLLSFFIVRRV